MTDQPRQEYDIEEIKRRLPFVELMVIEGIEMRRSGANYVACCPFHGERSPSFTVHAARPTHGHCYGCGWDGDIFDFWQARHDVGLGGALSSLASLASVPAFIRSGNKSTRHKVPQMTERADERQEKPPLPRMRALKKEEIVALAKLRELSAEGVAAAAEARRVGFCMWPQFQDRHEGGAWRPFHDAGGCWVVTDGERSVAQFRRLDGRAFIAADGHEIKAWTKGSPRWPLGAAEMGDRAAVLLVEGGADMLAAYHFLWMFRRLDRVAVVSMLGGSSRISEAALPYFRRKRVRIMMDEDLPKAVPGHPEKPPVYPGREAAARWTEQLSDAGAAVETFSLDGLTRNDGERVKDLNDLAVVDESAWLDGELKAAFFDFDF